MTTYTCPECDSEEVTLTHEQSFMANTLEHFCHSVKVQDPESKASCLECGWHGRHDQLITDGGEMEPHDQAWMLAEVATK